MGRELQGSGTKRLGMEMKVSKLRRQKMLERKGEMKTRIMV
jgi:hypothetical protein